MESINRIGNHLLNKKVKVDESLTKLLTLERQIEDNVFPVGSIISIHPSIDKDKAVNSDYWEACDGSTGKVLRYRDGTIENGFVFPDLTDDRFLMGISGTTTTSGGSNILVDHKHCTHDTNLNLVSSTTSGGAGDSCTISSGTCQPSSTACAPCTNVAGAHTHPSSCRPFCHIVKSGSKVQTAGAPYLSTGYGGAHTHSTCSHSHAVGNHSHTLNHSHTMSTQPSLTCSVLSGTIGSNGATNINLGTIEKRPQYFSVQYYIRVK